LRRQVASPIGFDLNFIPGLENFINNQIHATLGPMLYDPNVFQIDLEQLLSSAPIGERGQPTCLLCPADHVIVL
jgi:Ca2+-dependent lipid-binding protein